MSVRIQIGHVARHTPQGAGAQGREAAIIDIAQDLLLQRLHQQGILDDLVIKGGTAIRKLYAGKEGRFSLDLDFSFASISTDPDDVTLKLVEAIDGLTINPFVFGINERRGKYSLSVRSPFHQDQTLLCKLDLSPAPWLDPVYRGWKQLPIHKQYGEKPLPEIKTLRIEENLAEKIARLNRATLARDMYDLYWIMTTSSIAETLDLPLIRRLALLKNWVDCNGLHAESTYWKPGHAGKLFDAELWLRDRSNEDFDAENIGALAVPLPSVQQMSEAVSAAFSFLADFSEEEQIISYADERHRSLIIKTLRELPTTQLNEVNLY